MTSIEPGKVYLVGAGPGDPGLISVKGLELVKNADVVVYDQLGTAAFIPLVKADAELIDVGKKAGKHTLPQDQINQVLVKKAKEGKTVLRLKGGDPMVFGRGGEELEELYDAGIKFEVVPGITSAISAPEYAGIPATHRDCTSTLAIITGHEAAKDNSAIKWNSLTDMGTLIFLMGVKNLPKITANLMSAGKTPSTPIALIQNGTLTSQKTVTGTLETIVEIVEKARIKAPAVTIVGDVVNYRQKLKWFENRPLFGKRIVVTRSRHQASQLSQKLRNLGAEVIESPTIKITKIAPSKELTGFINGETEYSHLIFTSVNGVEHFIEMLLENGKDIRFLGNKKIICIGPATADAFKKRGIVPDFVPDKYIAESIIPYFEGKNKYRVAILRAETAREILPEKLKEIGHEIKVFPVYRTIREDSLAPLVTEGIKSSTIDMVTFTSSSTVKGFAQHLKELNKKDFNQIPCIAIGPITANTCKEYNLDIKATAKTYTIEGLIETILNYFNQQE
jgi:uroporphyrinogen III methyltransferase/synthase